MKTKIPYKQQLYLISICVIKNKVFVTFDFHTLKKLNFFFTTNLDQQISGCSDIT